MKQFFITAAQRRPHIFPLGGRANSRTTPDRETSTDSILPRFLPAARFARQKTILPLQLRRRGSENPPRAVADQSAAQPPPARRIRSRQPLPRNHTPAAHD